MNRAAAFFVGILSPILALILATLGFITLSRNATGIFLIIAGLFYGVGVIIVYWIRKIPFWNPSPQRNTTAEEHGDRSFWMILPGMAGSFFLAPLEYLLVPEIIPRHPSFPYAGLLLVLVGAALFIYARRKIKSSYSGHLAVQAEQKLVQSGPYRLIRHPSYAGFLLMAAGVTLGYSSLLGLVCILFLLLPGLVYRIGVEEKLLKAHFQEEYSQYAARTSRLIPGIW